MRARSQRYEAFIGADASTMRGRWPHPRPNGTVARRRRSATKIRMATKAERFRAALEQSRSRPHAPVEKVPRERTASRSTHLGRKATVKLEKTVGGSRPSRKSTRKAANRMKPNTNLERKQK